MATVLVRHVAGDLCRGEDVDQVEEQLEGRRPMVLTGGANPSKDPAASLRLALLDHAQHLLATVQLVHAKPTPKGGVSPLSALGATVLAEEARTRAADAQEVPRCEAGSFSSSARRSPSRNHRPARPQARHAARLAATARTDPVRFGRVATSGANGETYIADDRRALTTTFSDLRSPWGTER